MALSARGAAALLVGAGGAGAVTMLALLLTDGSDQAQAARLGARAFALLLTLPLALGLTTLLHPRAGQPAPVRGLATFGALFWLGGLGADVFNAAASGSFLLGAHAAALLGGLAFAGAGAWALQGPPTRRERRARARE